jgi:hypothetical protein
VTGRDRNTDDHGTPLLPGRTIRVCTRGVREQQEWLRVGELFDAQVEWERMLRERKAVRV